MIPKLRTVMVDPEIVGLTGPWPMVRIFELLLGGDDEMADLPRFSLEFCDYIRPHENHPGERLTGHITSGPTDTGLVKFWVDGGVAWGVAKGRGFLQRDLIRRGTELWVNQRDLVPL